MQQRPRYLFSLDSGIVSPLYSVARLCRDPQIRRKAIGLLREYPIREGMWDGLLAAKASEIQMEVEEELAREMLPDGQTELRCASDIPREARIVTVLPQFRPGERKARCLLSKNTVPHSMDQVEWHYHRDVEW